MSMSIESEFSGVLQERSVNPDERVIRDRITLLQEFLQSDDGDDELTILTKGDIVDSELERLDDLCPHLGEFVRVSGQVKCGYFDEFQGGDLLETRSFVDESVISRGYAVSVVLQDDGTEVDQVGHLFMLPGTARASSPAPLTENTTQYFAFAPFESVVIKQMRTPEQRIAYLEEMIPDILDDFDQLIDGADNPVAALMRLRHMSIDPSRLPDDVLRELVAYATDVLGIDASEEYEMKLRGVFSIDSADGTSYTFAHDQNDPFGGREKVIARLGDIYLAPYVVLAGGQPHTTSSLYWGACLVATSDSRHLRTNRGLDVSIADIEDIQSVRDYMLDRWTTSDA